MQEGFPNYAMSFGECCLNCYDSEPGCLCYECKCTKCCWYRSPDENPDDNYEKGKCDYIKILIKEREEEKIKRYKEKIKLLEKENERVKKILKKKNEIINTYTCQRCKLNFISEEHYKIKRSVEPICFCCKNGL